ncbi:transposase [Rhizobium leguminosarum]|uniref:transposase n=1 Tax=Rhizobium leguminosarum TaxID=384 RepID=UPI001C964546|nr:transposase [Rhizobium leguminosarum]MBY5370562.1 transposase [Rhizobium leguminosarum]
MRVEILGQERRRRWREEDKLAIVMSVGVSGATITEIAHRHDVTRQQIYAWRSELKKKGLLSASANALFIPVDMNAVQTDVRYGSGDLGTRHDDHRDGKDEWS